jgi:alpha-mannosidase
VKNIDREALTKNEKSFGLSFYPSGLGKKPKPLAIIEDSAVQISTIKLSEDGKAIIFRLFEPTGKTRTAMLHIPVLGMKIEVELGGFEIKTLKVNLKTRKYKFVNLVES